MVSRRPEDFIPTVRRAARYQASRLRFADEDDLYGAAMEALVRQMPDEHGDPALATDDNYRARVFRLATFRMYEEHRRWMHEAGVRQRTADWYTQESARPLRSRHATLDPIYHDWGCGDIERDATAAMEFEDLLACLTPVQRRVALAAMEHGGQRRLAAEMGLTEGRLSQIRGDIRRRVAGYLDDAASA